jgi:hypothetical protein
VVSVTPRPRFTPGKDPVPTLYYRINYISVLLPENTSHGFFIGICEELTGSFLSVPANKSFRY